MSSCINEIMSLFTCPYVVRSKPVWLSLFSGSDLTSKISSFMFHRRNKEQVWNDMMTAFPFWCERSLKTLDKITIKHLICYIAFHPASVQLCDLWHSLCVGSVISIWSGCAWRFISVHGSELIWCVFVCMMKPYRDSLASLLSICLLWPYKTWI